MPGGACAQIAAREHDRGRFGGERDHDRGAIAVVPEAEQRLVLADEQEHERGRGKADTGEREQDVQAAKRKQQSERDQRRTREVEREQRPDHRHDVEVDSEVLLQMYRADHEHGERAEHAQDGSSPARALTRFGEHDLVEHRACGTTAAAFADLAHQTYELAPNCLTSSPLVLPGVLEAAA